MFHFKLIFKIIFSNLVLSLLLPVLGEVFIKYSIFDTEKVYAQKVLKSEAKEWFIDKHTKKWNPTSKKIVVKTKNGTKMDSVAIGLIPETTHIELIFNEIKSKRDIKEVVSRIGDKFSKNAKIEYIGRKFDPIGEEIKDAFVFIDEGMHGFMILFKNRLDEKIQWLGNGNTNSPVIKKGYRTRIISELDEKNYGVVILSGNYLFHTFIKNGKKESDQTNLVKAFGEDFTNLKNPEIGIMLDKEQKSYFAVIRGTNSDKILFFSLGDNLQGVGILVDE